MKLEKKRQKNSIRGKKSKHTRDMAKYERVASLEKYSATVKMIMTVTLSIFTHDAHNQC